MNKTMMMAVFAVAASAAMADVKLMGIFSDDMVLQRGKPIPVRGTAEPGEEVQTRHVSEDELCTVYDYTEKYTIKIDIPKAKLTATRLFTQINKQIKFLNSILFKTSPRAGRNPKR